MVRADSLDNGDLRPGITCVSRGSATVAGGERLPLVGVALVTPSARRGATERVFPSAALRRQYLIAAAETGIARIFARAAQRDFVRRRDAGPGTVERAAITAMGLESAPYTASLVLFREVGGEVLGDQRGQGFAPRTAEHAATFAVSLLTLGLLEDAGFPIRRTAADLMTAAAMAPGRYGALRPGLP